MKKLLLVLSITSLIVFVSCKKDNNPPTLPVPNDTLSAGWQKINFIDSSYLVDIFFINNTGYAISSNIYKSSDGGDNWSLLKAASGLNQNTYFNIGMGNEESAVFVSPNNPLVVTQNSGANFTTKMLPDPVVTDVFFVDYAIAYAVGNSVWKTMDAGDNWTKLHDFTPSNDFSSIFFTNEQTGWVLKHDGVYKTINGGTDWQIINTDKINLGHGGAVFFLNADTGYISNANTVEKTVDGGASWNKVFTSPYSGYHDIHFVSGNVGYITDGPRIFKTTDAGNTWTKVVAMASSTRIFVELHFTDANHGWACGGKGTIVKFSQ